MSAPSILLAHPAEPRDLSMALLSLGIPVLRSSTPSDFQLRLDRWINAPGDAPSLLVAHEAIFRPGPIVVLEAAAFAGLYLAVVLLSSEAVTRRQIGICACLPPSTPGAEIVQVVVEEIRRRERWRRVNEKTVRPTSVRAIASTATDDDCRRYAASREEEPMFQPAAEAAIAWGRATRCRR